MDILQKIILVGPILLFSVIAHEYAHGYAALRQGDATAYQLGRLTWNPVRHIDPFLTILLPLLMMLAPGGGIIAGAKPVPVNPRNFRNYKRGDIIVSLAGVATNLLVAIGCAAAILVTGLVARFVPALDASLSIVQAMLVIGILLNFVLIVFNLLPIPPLDGSHVMKYLLPPAWAIQYQELGRRFGFLLLIGLVVLAPGFLVALLTPAYVAARLLLRLVDGFVLIGVQQWLQWL